MLKKLVKYGNSNALVFDKALLELLDIAQGATVKIRTDGKSLIITPHDSIDKQPITKTITPEEAFREAAIQQIGLQCANPSRGSEYFQELTHVMDRHRETAKKLSIPVIYQSLQELDEQFKNNRNNPAYLKAMIVLRDKYTPELTKVDQEIQELSEKYALDDLIHSPHEKKDNLSLAMMQMYKTHRKYHHVQMQVDKLQENSDFIHESVLVAERYHVSRNVSMYVQEYINLVSGYIPEYRAYQEELKQITQEYIKRRDEQKNSN